MKQKLIDYLNEFVKVFDSDYSVKQGEEFEALLDEETIVVYGGVDESDFYFLENIYRFPGSEKLPLLHLFTWSFLHELGHFETVHNMIDDTDDRFRLKCAIDSTRDNFEEYCIMHNEVIANNWAREFVLENIGLMKEFDRQVRDLLY